MPVTWRASLAYLMRHPWQLALSVVGISIGVAVIVAVDLANSSARKAFLLSMDQITGSATHQVIGGPSGVSDDLYTKLRVEHGIDQIAPVVEGDVTASDIDLRLLGVDLFAEASMQRFTEQASADGALFQEFLLEPGGVMLSDATAGSLGVTDGDRFTVERGGLQVEAVLLGTFEEDASLDAIAVVDIATAKAWLDMPDALSRIDVRLDENEVDTFRALLPAGNELLTAEGRTQSTADMSAAFMTNLSAMSLLALLVGLFLIYNSVSFSVLQRRELIGTLRALGVTRRQTVALIVGESTLLGAVAAAGGLALGIVLGEQLLALVSRSINDLYFRVSVTDVSVSAFSVAKGLAAGVGAAFLAAIVPALEAGSYAPRLAMTRSALETRTGALLPWVAATGVAIIIAAVLVLLASGRSLIAGLTAVFMLIAGFALCVPLIVRAFTGVLAPLAARIGRTVARLAVSGIAASLSRTGVAIVALSVAVSATIGVSVMVDSFRSSVADWLDTTLRADIYTGVRRGDFDESLLADITSLPEVAAFSTSRQVTLESAAGRTRILAIDMAPQGYAGTELIDADADEVWPAWEAGDAILVSQPYAYQQRKAPGDTVSLRTDEGSVDFGVLAVYESYDANGSAIMMSRSTYDRYFDDDGVDSIGLYLAAGASPESTIEEIRALSAGRQELLLNSNAKIRELSLEIFDQTFVITDVLYWLATGVALIGILSSMLALQLEKGREQGLLRALGMTPAQIGGMITLQTGVIGLLSGLSSIPLGLVMAWVLIEVINRRAFGWQIDMSVAPEILVTAVLFAIGAALVAGLYPAWRAGRAEPALAMREE